ncbi:hypothetical protein T440DRAFT_240166 [Plenodomus tracheiphilus IPT5]|uniref:Uncharacterized protein n=1 Tax=Plenodomus tracheiphilus IPT5 TaxID=1408161 RepID=A0A6A7BGX0_9PLEO|nr:hypothetical protein T440DRAFT_240166 [Plenodomus tracheiphilus IPT5]
MRQHIPSPYLHHQLANLMKTCHSSLSFISFILGLLLGSNFFTCYPLCTIPSPPGQRVVLCRRQRTRCFLTCLRAFRGIRNNTISSYRPAPVFELRKAKPAYKAVYQSKLTSRQRQLP